MTASKSNPAPKRPSAGPEAPGEVTLPLATYLQLFEQSRESYTPPPPAPWAVHSAEYTGEVVGTRATITVSILGEVFSSGWVRVPLFDTSVALTEVDLDGKQLSLIVSGSRYELVAKKEGKFGLKATLVCPLIGGGGGSGLQFTIPRAATNQLTLRVPRREIAAKIGHALEVHTEAHADGESTAIQAVLPPTDTIAAEWSAADEGDLEQKDQPAVVEAEVATLVSVGEGVARCSTQVDYDILQGEVSTFQLHLPEDVTVHGVDGAAMRTWATRPAPAGDGQLVDVQLHYPVGTAHSLSLTYERKMAETSGVLPVPVCAVKDVERQRGFVAVEARTNVEITPETAEMVARVDIQELPGALWDSAQNPLLFGWKYLKTPYTIALNIKKHADVEVLVATIDAARLEATLVEDGRLETKATFVVRNNQKQYLRVTLPEQSTVWSTFVSDGPVKPAVDADDPATILVTLEKSQDTSEFQQGFPLEIVYLTEVPKLGKKGQIAFQAPRVDVPINIMQVSLHLPTEYRFKAFEGSLKKVNSLRYVETYERTVTRGTTTASMTRAGGAMSNVAQVQMNAFDAAETSMGLEQAMEEPQQQMVVKAPPMKKKSAGFFGAIGGLGSTNKGVLPVRMEVPSYGQTFYFEKLIVLDEFPSLTGRYKKK